MTDEFIDKDWEHVALLFERSGGKAWEPPAPNHPWIVKLIEHGFLRRCDMRCMFEAFKDSGVTWTTAGRIAIESRMKELVSG